METINPDLLDRAAEQARDRATLESQKADDLEKELRARKLRDEAEQAIRAAEELEAQSQRARQEEDRRQKEARRMAALTEHGPKVRALYQKFIEAIEHAANLQVEIAHAISPLTEAGANDVGFRVHRLPDLVFAHDSIPAGATIETKLSHVFADARVDGFKSANGYRSDAVTAGMPQTDLTGAMAAFTGRRVAADAEATGAVRGWIEGFRSGRIFRMPR